MSAACSNTRHRVLTRPSLALVQLPSVCTRSRGPRCAHLRASLGATTSLPMRRRRVFKYQPKAEPQLVASVEKQLVDLMHGEAPQDWIIEDVAEIWVPDAENASGGAWLPLADVSAAKLKELAAAT